MAAVLVSGFDPVELCNMSDAVFGTLGSCYGLQVAWTG